MSSPFQIWIDRLKNGQTQPIDESFQSDFLDVQEHELKMDYPVHAVGEAYLTESELIIHLSASTKLKMPCAICNEMIEVDLDIRECYHAVPINEIPSGIYDYKEFLRESLLIEVPKYVECNQRNCPERKTIAPYMHEKQKETSNFPFSNLGDSNGSTT